MKKVDGKHGAIVSEKDINATLFSCLLTHTHTCTHVYARTHRDTTVLGYLPSFHKLNKQGSCAVSIHQLDTMELQILWNYEWWTCLWVYNANNCPGLNEILVASSECLLLFIKHLSLSYGQLSIAEYIQIGRENRCVLWLGQTKMLELIPKKNFKKEKKKEGNKQTKKQRKQANKETKKTRKDQIINYG